jgi:hypothetical protein
MPTIAQIEANRLNALKSTGPRTPAGKARSARNALQHGLCSAEAVIPGEDPAEYDALAQAFLDELQPCGILELSQVRQMIAAEWRMRRIQRLETALIKERMADRKSWLEKVDRTTMPEDPAELTELFDTWAAGTHAGDQILRFRAYLTTFHRMFERALRTFLGLHKQRERQERPAEKTQSTKTNPIPRKSRKTNNPDPAGQPGTGPPITHVIWEEVA